MTATPVTLAGVLFPNYISNWEITICPSGASRQAALNPLRVKKPLTCYMPYWSEKDYRNSVEDTKCDSPMTLKRSKPSWLLAGDISNNITWADNVTNHIKNNGTPAGANWSFVDGHVEWVERSAMVPAKPWNVYLIPKVKF